MGPKKQTKNATPSPDPNGMFSGMSAFLVETGVQPRRLQIWKLKLVQMGATLEDRFSENVTHVFAANFPALHRRVDRSRLHRFKGRVLLYQWLEDSLRLGEKVSEDLYGLQIDAEGEEGEIHKSMVKPEDDGNVSGTNEFSPQKRTRASFEADSRNDAGTDAPGEVPSSPGGNGDSSRFLSPAGSTSPRSPSMPEKDLSLLYKPLDLNRNITEIFGKLTNIYRALGDDRRSFSYYKAIPVIEKLPFKIENSDQVKNQTGIGKSIQDHIQEIVTTGKLSKLEHFETDEKVRTISLFGEIWGIGPATALKLYGKGYRTLEDLKNEDSLTYSQKIGLKYFDDIRTRIPRYEAEDMGKLLQKIGEEILPGVIIVCGGSYRRGKASCGDLDVVITHPDGQSHKGFLPKFVKRLKEINFLREDLIFSSHSEEGTDSGVDTYFGLCTYRGRELRHRVDFKVYPRNIYAFGLIAWTGNDVLNRRLRLLAESRGYRMDDTGLYPATQASGGKRGGKGTASLKFDTEKEVFDFLGFPWLEPHERNL